MRLFLCISRLTTLFGSGSRLAFSSFALVASVLFSSSAYSADYYWTSQIRPGNFASAYEACKPSIGAPFGGTATFSRVDFGGSQSSGTCVYVWGAANDEYRNENVYRGGDSCPTGKVYNPAKGSCDGPPEDKCKKAQGAVTKFNWKSTSDTPAKTVSLGGCEATISGIAICLSSISGGYNCSGNATITGEKMEGSSKGNSSECEGAACTDPVPQNQSSENPCQAVSTGSGFTCTATKEESKPGSGKCGDFNGAWVCTQSPQPTSTKSTSKITQTATANSDGSTTTKTTTVTDTTSCKGIGNCTTGTTTTVVSGGTNSNGTSKPPSSNCSGPECGGGTVGPGTGSGSAPGEEEEPEEEEEDKGQVSGDMVCGPTVACSGDVIQCAVLRQEHASRCADEEFREVTEKKVTDMKNDMTSEFAGKDYQAIKPTAETSFDLSNMIDTSSKLSASCPVLPNLNYTWVDGSTRNLNFNISGLCTFLTYMGYLMVAFAMRRAAEIIATGIA